MEKRINEAVMINKKIYIYINNLPYRITGVEISALQRAHILSQYEGYDVYILIRSFNKNLLKIIDNFRSRFDLGNKVFFINLYADFLGFFCVDSLNLKDDVLENKKYDVVKLSETHERLYAKDKKLNKYVVYFDKENAENFKPIDYINYFFNGEKIKKEHFLLNGKIVFVQEFDQFGKCYRAYYYDYLGVVRIVIDYQSGNIKLIYLNDERGNLFEIFKTEDDLFVWWLEKFYLGENSIVLIDGGPHHIQSFRGLKSKLAIVSILHSNHIQVGQNILTGNFYSSERKRLLETPDSVDACIILTEEQKNDIDSRLPQHCPLFTIEHSCFNLVKFVDFEFRDLDRMVIISRLEKEKNIFDAIDIVKMVVDELPNKKLYIYGAGSQEKELHKYIHENELSEYIFLMGYATDISKELNRASLFLMTSLYESFGLSILESLSHGVPVLSYDFRYGPRTLIQNKKNGFIVENKNKEKAAQTIIEYFKNINKMEVMMDNAYKSTQAFHPKKIAEKWSVLFNTLLENKFLK